jgi:hypothetical protein
MGSIATAGLWYIGGARDTTDMIGEHPLVPSMPKDEPFSSWFDQLTTRDVLVFC